jgi:uncharacterized protein YgiM (DUF1202 family)
MTIEEKIFNVCIWSIALCALVILMTSCSPFDNLQIGTPTPAPSMTATATAQPIEVTAIPRPSCTVSTGVPAGKLNIRTGAGVQYSVIGLLHEGQVLTLTGSRADGWIEVITGNLSGWINSRYCRKEIRP